MLNLDDIINSVEEESMRQEKWKEERRSLVLNLISCINNERQRREEEIKEYVSLIVNLVKDNSAIIFDCDYEKENDKYFFEVFVNFRKSWKSVTFDIHETFLTKNPSDYITEMIENDKTKFFAELSVNISEIVDILYNDKKQLHEFIYYVVKIVIPFFLQHNKSRKSFDEIYHLLDDAEYPIST